MNDGRDKNGKGGKNDKITKGGKNATKSGQSAKKKDGGCSNQ